MTKREKAKLQEAIDELEQVLESDDMSMEDRKNIEHHLDALRWVQEAIAT